MYLFMAGLLWSRFQHIMFKDEMVFLTIAERYAPGLFATAPNAFWPPLISWLEALELRTGLPTEVAVRLLSVVIGVYAYVSLQLLLTALCFAYITIGHLSIFIGAVALYLIAALAFGFGFNKQKVLSAAEKFVQQGKLPNAITEYEKVLKADPKDLTFVQISLRGAIVFAGSAAVEASV